MKKLMYVFVLIISATAHAAVVDTLNCTGTLEDLLTGQKAIATHSFDVLRKPGLSGPPEASIFTIGASSFDLFLETNDYQISTNLRILYQHAARKKNGTMDAVQNDCTSISVGFCDRTDPNATCNHSVNFCFSVDDPFDSLNGWTKVPFINGAPAFENRLLKAMQGVVKNIHGEVIAKYSSSCTHTGTTAD
jgi:hypothetical protein